MGLPGTNPLCVPRFLFVGNRLHLTSMTFPEFQRAGSVANQGREGMQRQGWEQSRNKNEALGQGPGSSSRNIRNTILELFCRTKAHTQVEEGNFWLSARFREHRPVTSPPTNQKKVTHPAALTPNSAYENRPPNHQGFRDF